MAADVLQTAAVAIVATLFVMALNEVRLLLVERYKRRLLAKIESAIAENQAWWTPSCGYEHIGRNLTIECPDGHPPLDSPGTGTSDRRPEDG
jgi:hypothetical protein